MNATTQDTNPKDASDRRSFLRTAAIAGAAIAGAGWLNSPLVRAVSPALTLADIPGTGDTKILNYALALEDLESDLYDVALKRLTTGGQTSTGVTIHGLGLSNNLADVKYIQEFGVVEAQHRDLLRTTLGNDAIPQYDHIFGLETATRAQVLEQIYLAEALGVGAYLGVVKFISDTSIAQIAGAILGTEARHTAVIAEIADSFGFGVPVAPMADENNGIDTPIPPVKVLARVSPFIVVP